MAKFTIEEARGLAAQAWQAPANTAKEMDSDLAEAFAVILMQQVSASAETSPEVAHSAGVLMSMDDDEMRKAAVRPIDVSVGDNGATIHVEPPLIPEFCDMVRSVAATAVRQSR